MRLRRSSEGPAATSEDTTVGWDGVPSRAAAEPLIKAPRAAEAAAPHAA
jgi:hypothetical protein